MHHRGQKICQESIEGENHDVVVTPWGGMTVEAGKGESRDLKLVSFPDNIQE